MFAIREEKMKRYVVFSVVGFIASVILYTWNNILITNSPIDVDKLLAMAVTFDPKVALSFFEYLATNGFQWNETFTLILNIVFLCAYGFLYRNFYSVIALSKVIAKPFVVVAPVALRLGLFVALADFVKTVVLMSMVYFYQSMPGAVVLVHTTLTFIVMPLYSLMLLWFFVNCIFLGIGYLTRRAKLQNQRTGA